MEDVKFEIKGDAIIFEGEFDIELDLNTIHFGYPPEDEDLFNKTAFEIKSYGELNLKYLMELVRWLNIKSVSKKPSAWPRWRLTIERLYDGKVGVEHVEKEPEEYKKRHRGAMEDLDKMRFL